MHAKENINSVEKQPTEWEKYFQTMYLTRGWYSKYVRNSKSYPAKHQVIQFKNGINPNTHFSKENIKNGQQLH